MNMQVISAAQASALLRASFLAGKNAGHPQRWVPMRGDDADWIHMRMSLDWIDPNEDGDRYDSTVDRARAQSYAEEPGDFPAVHISYGPRRASRGATTAAVQDGGHRVTAARLRGDKNIFVLLPKAEAEQLLAARVEYDRSLQSVNSEALEP
jgi:hypothetical protein